MIRRIVFCCVIILVFVLLPWAVDEISGANHKPVELPDMIGITLDIIPAADVTRGSREMWLRDRAGEFESMNPGVFISVRMLKRDQAELLYREGNIGELAAYTAGYSPCLSRAAPIAVDTSGLTMELALSGVSEGATIAVPYMYSEYAILANDAYISDKNDDIDIDDVMRALSDDGDILPIVCAMESSDASFIALAMSGIAGKASVRQRTDAILLFARGKAMMIVASGYTLNRLNNMRDAGDAGAFSIVSGTELKFTDQIHYISMTDAADENEALVCSRFIEFLLSPTSQAKASGIGMLSTLDLSRVDVITDDMNFIEAKYSSHFAPDVTGYAAKLVTLSKMTDELRMMSGDDVARIVMPELYTSGE